MPTTKRSGASWSDVKAKLVEFDRAALLALVHDLYAAGKENQAFLHTRFGLGGDVLKPYQSTISRWLWPDVFRGQDTSVAKAKKAIADYRKADGKPHGLAELAVFFCEQASGFAAEVAMDNEADPPAPNSSVVKAMELVLERFGVDHQCPDPMPNCQEALRTKRPRKKHPGL